MVATPDAVWHRDSHYWRKFIGGVHKIQISIRELLEECLRNFFGEEIGGGSGAFRPHNDFWQGFSIDCRPDFGKIFGQVFDQGTWPPSTVLQLLPGRKIQFCEFYGLAKYSCAGSMWDFFVLVYCIFYTRGIGFSSTARITT